MAEGWWKMIRVACFCFENIVLDSRVAKLSLQLLQTWLCIYRQSRDFNQLF